jgi:hypothetical protein
MPHSRAETMRVEERRAKVAALALQGLRSSEIATRLGDDSKTGRVKVSQDIEAIRRAWATSTVRDFDAEKSRSLAALDMLMREVWAGYERSKENRTSVRDRQLLSRALKVKPLRLADENSPGDTDEDDGLEPIRVERERHAEKRDGDPRWLQLFLACLQERNQLLGLIAAKPGDLPTCPPITTFVLFPPTEDRPDPKRIEAVVVPAGAPAPGNTPPRPDLALPAQATQRPPTYEQLPSGADPDDYEWVEDDDDGMATKKENDR